MAPKSQLCACSFQDSLWQKNWALEQIREFPDTFGYVWTAENDSNTLRVDAKIFVSAKKCLRKKKFPDTCGHGLVSQQREMIRVRGMNSRLFVNHAIKFPEVAGLFRDVDEVLLIIIMQKIE